MAKLPKPELIYMAGLYHDIGKGRHGDHSELGAVDAEAFCKRHHLPAWDSRLIVWLVQTQRKDLSDPQVIHDFAQIVGDNAYLDYLYVLTVADINATNPTLWNSWRASLLRQLYTETTVAWRTQWTARSRFARPRARHWTSWSVPAPTPTMSSSSGRNWATTTSCATPPLTWPGIAMRSCSSQPMAAHWC